MFPHMTVAQVHYTAGRVQQPRICVPLINRRGVTAIGACQLLDGSDSLRAGNGRRDVSLAAF